ncbi:hypothetical protein ACPEIF_23855 [Streptomyces sp. NPDC012600]|uniref:Uncharacterized protein n=3 Tax=Streptomycetaceae TaxID=2062 RepID=A0ABU2W160_9ACTN|nr:hypothetical protein [Streptomyces griseus]ARF75423.1 hypothetical protein B7C62_26595 [Kitasatospora albolonga]MDT0491603.1 hypothetical protein [Streptomyces griseus]
MYEYELYRNTSAELIRRADAEREARRAGLARRAARRRSGRQDPEGRVSGGRGGPARFLRLVRPA